MSEPPALARPSDPQVPREQHPGGPASAPRRTAGRLGPPLAVLAGAGAALGFVARVDPGVPGHYPACLFLRLTGLDCPGCGGLRATHALLHGHLPAALHDNLLAVPALAAAAVGWVLWTVRTARDVPAGPAPRPSAARRPAVRWAALCVLLLVFTVLRNLPPLRGALTP